MKDRQNCRYSTDSCKASCMSAFFRRTRKQALHLVHMVHIVSVGVTIPLWLDKITLNPPLWLPTHTHPICRGSKTSSRWLGVPGSSSVTVVSDFWWIHSLLPVPVRYFDLNPHLFMLAVPCSSFPFSSPLPDFSQVSHSALSWIPQNSFPTSTSLTSTPALHPNTIEWQEGENFIRKKWSKRTWAVREKAENTQRDIKGLKGDQAPGRSSVSLRLGGGRFSGNALVLGLQQPLPSRKNKG